MRAKYFNPSLIAIMLILGNVSSARAEDNSEKIWDVITVLGSKESEASLPGSGDRVSSEDMRKHSYDDINRILRKVPGVYVREEDGYGLFPSIGLRGVDISRNQKVTVMEDGITAAPAPYSSPAAYYSPTAGRMNSIEVLKGSSQIKYGPHTTGGVINYISTQIPTEREIYLKGLYGSENETRIHGFIGDKIETSKGRFGYLLEQYYRENDGFKTIDTTADFSDGDDTGFTKTEPMFKFSWETPLDAYRYQKVEAKFGYTDLKANETYLGLTEADFKNNPYRRYSATRFDNIDSENARSYLRYATELGENTMVSLTGYYNQFQRNWRKLHKVNGDSLANALAAGGTSLSILKGEAAGSFDVRNNNREYAQWGYLSNVNFDFSIGETVHNLEIGLGYHRDYVRRNQNTITYTQDAYGVITGSSVSAPGTAGNRRQDTQSISSYIRDSIDIGQWTITPGFRYENINYEYVDYNTKGSPDIITGRNTSTMSALAGGIGVNYEFSEELSAFGGIHQGFSVPGPRDNAKKGLKEETSLTKEVGVRFKPTQAFNTEFVYFHTSFNDLLVKDNIGGSGSGNSENVGSVLSQGIEFKAQYDLGIAQRKTFNNPYYIAFTYTDAQLDGDSNSTDSESIFSGGKDGNKVPYIPEHQFTIGTGLEFSKWGVFIDGTYVAETFATANNVSNKFQADGVTPDARFGKIDEFFVVDLSGHYNINKHTKLVANLHNVGDLEYIVSRQPHGPRPGKPFTATVGLEMKF
ncbi:TonB-dependent receptor; Outer membrane receptor for ferrienterochelin and colicins [hydrothermal vent metagenome]|uniref:TonB-dependent receptor Outer membrane receptor for ferrienterochelin and colicins n=1 Tax=hydrothermal vent metagenome TaxID=652676 RepID=A0A3B1DKQ7_9ZZZZ